MYCWKLLSHDAKVGKILQEDYFCRKNIKNSLSLALVTRRSSINFRRWTATGSKAIRRFCRRAQNYEKRAKLWPTMNIHLQKSRSNSTFYGKDLNFILQREGGEIISQPEIKTKAKVSEMCVDLAFLLT